MNQQRIIFMGTPQLAATVLQALAKDWRVVGVVTQADKAQGRGLAIKSSPVKKAAEALGMKIFEPEKIKNNPEFLNEIKSLEPDLIVVAAYGKILPQEFLDIPKYGVLNLHGSFLPRHRGASPIQAAILAGDKTTGMTLMKMVLEVDAGPILAQSQPVEIEPDDTFATLSSKLATVAAKLLTANLAGYFAGILPQTPQEEKLATWTKPITKEEAHLNFNEPALELERKIRAYNPWPVAWAKWNGELIKIYQAEVKTELTELQPGQVAEINKALLVGTGKGALKIKTIQLAGKKQMSGEEFLRGQRNFSGAILT